MSITFSLFAEPIEKQLNSQGLTLGDKAESGQKLLDAIFKLTFANIITESQTNKAFQRLGKWVEKNCKATQNSEKGENNA